MKYLWTSKTGYHSSLAETLNNLERQGWEIWAVNAANTNSHSYSVIIARKEVEK